MTRSGRLGQVAGIPVVLRWQVVVIPVQATEIVGAGKLAAVTPQQRASTYWITAVTGAVVVVTSLLPFDHLDWFAGFSERRVHPRVTSGDLRRLPHPRAAGERTRRARSARSARGPRPTAGGR